MAKKDKIRFNFDPKFQLHRACCNDNIRPALGHIFFREGYAYATNAFIAVKAKLTDICTCDPTSIELLNGYAIHADDFRKLLKYDSIIIEKDGIIRIEDGSFNITIQLKREVKEPKEKMEVHGPDVDAVIRGNNEGNEAIKAIGFNASLLNELRAAMGLDAEIKFAFRNAKKPIIVSACNKVLDYDVQGIIMPRLVD